MGSLSEELSCIFQASDEDWLAVWSHAVKKPLLPVGKAQKHYLHLSELAKLSERYALPPYTPDERESWLREAVLAFDASDPYQCTRMDTATIEEAARQWFADINQDDFWVATCRSDLYVIWELETNYFDIKTYYALLQSDEPLPELNQHDKARYLAVEALTFQKIEPIAFDVPKVLELYQALSHRAQGAIVKGRFADALNALPPLPKLTGAFEKALNPKALAPLYGEYRKMYPRFKENLRYFYGLEGGWVQRGVDPAPRHPLGPDRESDWGSRLVSAALKLSILTNRCASQVDELCNLLHYYCTAYQADFKLEGALNPQKLKIARYTKKEHARREKEEDRRHKEALERLAREEEIRKSSLCHQRGSGGARDEFDEANGSCEVGNSYSYAWYTDRDSYNDVTR